MVKQHRWLRTSKRTAAGLAGLLLLSRMVAAGTPPRQGVVPGAAQAGPQQSQPGMPVSHRPGSNPDPMDTPNPFSASNAVKLEHMREDDRHKRLVADTARLVSLSNELKSDVEKSSKDELSLDVVRKAAEIEKLAHDVKERMKS